MSARPKEYIALVGACYIDTILTYVHVFHKDQAHVDHYRTREFPKEDTKLRATSLSRRRGGNTPNSAEVLAQFATVKDGTNWAPLLISVVPDKSSADFQFIKNSLPAVDLDHCVHRSGKNEAPSSYIIRSEETSSRTIVNYNELEEMSFEEFKMVFEKIGKDVTLWHFEVGSVSRYFIFPGLSKLNALLLYDLGGSWNHAD
jgi:ketohexokinase